MEKPVRRSCAVTLQDWAIVAQSDSSAQPPDETLALVLAGRLRRSCSERLASPRGSRGRGRAHSSRRRRLRNSRQHIYRDVSKSDQVVVIGQERGASELDCGRQMKCIRQGIAPSVCIVAASSNQRRSLVHDQSQPDGVQVGGRRRTCCIGVAGDRRRPPTA
jgi:hypothetical protein